MNHSPFGNRLTSTIIGYGPIKHSAQLRNGVNGETA
jgi:hypothetical protein